MRWDFIVDKCCPNCLKFRVLDDDGQCIQSVTFAEISDAVDLETSLVEGHRSLEDVYQELEWIDDHPDHPRPPPTRNNRIFTRVSAKYLEPKEVYEKHFPPKPRKSNGLVSERPAKSVFITPAGTFCARFNRNSVEYQGTFKTLEEAVAYIDQVKKDNPKRKKVKNA